jgi:dTDP-4-amino-4,6-dideoxygalactose transaminase
MDLPLIRPNPPRLSALGTQLEALDASGIFTNNGPRVRRFEAALIERLFAGEGACLTVANATIGLMLAIRQAIGPGKADGRYALMPSFASAATAQAAIWNGLTPLLCDIDPGSWTADGMQEEALLARHIGQIAVMTPCATFGRSLDLDRYSWLSKRYDVPVVVNAAASLGTIDRQYRNFGTGSEQVFVYSMHAANIFAIGEGGMLYSADADRIAALRAMANFGFDDRQAAIMPGLNGAMSEIAAVMGLAKLAELDRVADHRAALAARYRNRLPDYEMQDGEDFRQAMPVMPVLLPPAIAPYRDQLIEAMAVSGIGVGKGLSPHLAEQPYFQGTARFESVPVCDEIAGRMLCFPLSDVMTTADVDRVCTRFRSLCAAIQHPVERRMRPRPIRIAVN